MVVRAKFRVTEQVNSEGYWEGKSTIMASLKMIPVYSEEEGHENRKFWDATPQGEFKISTVNPEAIKELVVGKEYYIDIIPVN